MKDEELTAIDFLKFEDWVALKEHERKDWIVVGRRWKNNQTDCWTFSALISGDRKGYVTSILTSDESPSDFSARQYIFKERPCCIAE